MSFMGALLFIFGTMAGMGSLTWMAVSFVATKNQRQRIVRHAACYSPRYKSYTIDELLRVPPRKHFMRNLFGKDPRILYGPLVQGILLQGRIILWKERQQRCYEEIYIAYIIERGWINDGAAVRTLVYNGWDLEGAFRELGYDIDSLIGPKVNAVENFIAAANEYDDAIAAQEILK